MALRLGLLSTARINEKILAGAAATPRVDVVAIAGRDRSRTDAYARSRGIACAYGSYEELLVDPDVDVVYVSLPNSLHVEWAVRALEAGKHVLCEKPLTRRPEEAERAFAVAERCGLTLMEGFMYRHNPLMRKLAELVAQGAAGRLRLIRAWLRWPIADGGDIRLNAALDGGSLMDLGCYCVHAARMIAGEPQRVYGEQVAAPGGVELAFQGTLRFDGDVVAQLDSSFLLPMHQGLEVVGEDASLRIAVPFRPDLGRPRIEIDRAGAVEWIEIEERDSYLLQLENLADAIEAGAEPLVDAGDSIAQAHVLARLYRAAETGVPS
jgi:D-xylose 1-dehydrogenase (NADP+, D-xylono-1,5-lactone-forming)